MTMEIPSYPKVWVLGHASLPPLSGRVRVEEKLDGSQFSFGIIGGELVMRSKGTQIYSTTEGQASEKMFNKAVVTVLDLCPLLVDGVLYRCEYLSKPKHNVLAYGRVPNKNLMVYDIGWVGEHYMSVEERNEEAARLGLEAIPVLDERDYATIDMDYLKDALDRESVLGGAKVEGIVLKAYGMFTRDGKTAMAKFVSEAFKEVHAKEWRAENPTGKDTLGAIMECYRTERRWEKGVEALRDAGKLEGSPKDIGALMAHVKGDVVVECEAEVKEKLWEWAKPHLLRTSTAGLPEWYKQRLASAALEPKE